MELMSEGGRMPMSNAIESMDLLVLSNVTPMIFNQSTSTPMTSSLTGRLLMYSSYGVVLFVMVALIFMCLFMLTKLFYNWLTIWIYNKSLCFAEDSLILSQILLTVFQSVCLTVATTGKIWPMIINDPDCCAARFNTIYAPIIHNSTIHQLRFPNRLHEMSLEASLAAVFLIPVVFPLSALFPTKCSVFYLTFVQSNIVAFATIWFPWLWICLLLGLPDLANWTLLFLCPMLVLHTVPMAWLMFYVRFCNIPSPKTHLFLRVFCPKEGPLKADSWHHRRWMSVLLHYSWTVVGYLPAIILVLLLPNCPNPAAAIFAMMIPTLVYAIGSIFTCTLLFCTRLVHHCDLCAKDEIMRMPCPRDQCNWCREHKGWVYRQAYRWPTPLGRHLQRCMWYRYALDSEGIQQYEMDQYSMQANRMALLSGV